MNQIDVDWWDSNWHHGAGTVVLISLTSWTPLISSSELLLWSIGITSYHHHEIDVHYIHKNQFSSPVTTTIILKNVGFPFFIQPIVASQWPLSPPPSSPWSPPGRGTTTRTWTSSPTETRALLPSSQVKTENLNLHKLNLEIIVKAYKTYNTLLMLIIDHPGTQSPIHHTNFMYALDDSLDTFMHQTKAKK